MNNLDRIDLFAEAPQKQPVVEVPAAEREFWAWMEKVAPETMKIWRRAWADELGRQAQVEKEPR